MILLTFNILNLKDSAGNVEELTHAENLEITIQNTNAILRSLDSADILATFFIEISIIPELKLLIKKINQQGHEVAFLNIDSTKEEIESVKINTQDFIGKRIRGIRLKEGSFTFSELHHLGFTYVSLDDDIKLLFPLKRFERKAPFTEQNGLIILHESISRYSQIPYNAYIFQALPLPFYKTMVIETIKKDEFVLIYLNSWQFTDFQKYDYGLPFHKKYKTGKKLHDKLDRFLDWMNEEQIAYSRIKDFAL